MAYNNLVTRAKAGVLEPEQTIVNSIIEGVVKNSTILPLMNRLSDMTSSQAKIPVLETLPSAYWVSGDTGLKQTTDASWKNKFIYAEELAVVVPIPINVYEDMEYNLFEQMRPRIVEAMYKKIDEAIILGKNKPPLWREGLIPSIINAGGAVAPSTDSLYVQISNAMGKVEEDGFNPDGILGGVGLRKDFRNGLLDTTNQPLANSEVTELPRYYADNGAWDSTLAKFIVGDFKQAVYAIRKDVEFKMFYEGVVTDNAGNILYNLMQMDMVAMRVTFRLGWQLPNPINVLNSDNTTRFPFALVEPTIAPTTYNVTFTVTDEDSNNVQGATVTLGGQEKVTNSSGQAVFKSLGNSTINYTVTKEGHNTAKGTVEVGTSATSVSVVNF